MPIYEYACPDCRNVFEKWLKLSETTENANCPKCGSRAQHILSNTSFVLKGGGWYVTDYGYRKGAGNDGQGAAGDAGKSATPSPSPAGASGQSAPPAPVAAPTEQSSSSAASGASA